MKITEPHWAIFVLTVLLTGALFAQGPEASPVQRSVTGPVNRYQLVTAKVMNETTEESTVFMIDTITGHVWKFQGSVVDGRERPTIRIFFIVVTFG